MADDATIQCGKCGRLVPAAMFCDNCGAPLAPASPDTPAARREAAAERDERNGSVAGGEERETTMEPIAAPRPREMRMPPSPVRPTDMQSDCDALEFSVDVSRVFVAGATFPLKVRLQSSGLELRRVKVEVATDLPGGGALRSGQTLDRLRAGGVRELSLDLSLPEGMQGEKTFRWSVCLERDGQPCRFEADPVRYTIYPGDASARKVVEQVVFNIHTGHASDVNIGGKGAAEDFFRSLRGGDGSVRELLDRMRNAPEVWQALPLHECELTLLDTAPPDAAVTGRLTLRAGQTLFHLIAGPAVQLGRNRQCELVTRLFSAAGAAEPDLNALLSRVHARIECGTSGWTVEDGGINPEDGRFKASSGGVFVNGQRVAPGVKSPLPLNRPFGLTLGAPAVTEPRVMGFDAELLTCERWNGADCPVAARCDRKRPACLLLRRRDRVPERFALIGCACAPGLSVGLPELGSLRVWRVRDAFAFKCGDQTGWLTPGIQLRLSGGTQVAVEGFQQWGL